MQHTNKRARWLSWLGLGVLFMALGIAGVVLPRLYTLALLALGIFTGLLLLKPDWILICLLLVRSSADVTQDLFTLFPGSSFSFNLAGLINILALGIGLIFLVRRFARGQHWLPSAPVFLLGLFLLVGALGISGSIDPPTSVKAWTRLAGYMGIALLTIEVAFRQDAILKILRTITLAAFPPLVLGYYQIFTGSGYFFPGFTATEFAYRPQGTFGHPAILASFLILVACLVLASLLWSYPLWPRPVLLGLMVAYLGLMVLTYARTEWIGGIVALGLIGLLRDRRVIWVGLLAGIILLLVLPSIQSRLSGEQSGESFEWRLELWGASLTLLEHPSWLGEGLDTSPILINSILPNVVQPPHNDYLRTALEMGVLGLIALLGLQAALFRLGWLAYRYSSQLDVKVLGLTLFGATVGGLVISLSDNFLSYVSVQWYMWTIVGLLSVDFRVRKPLLVEWGRKQ